MDLRAILRHEWYGGTVRTWLVALAIAVALSALLLVLRRLVRTRLERSAARTATVADDMVVELVRRTRAYAIIALSLAVAAQWLVLPDRLEGWVGRGWKVVLLLQFGIWGSTLIGFWVRRYVGADGHQGREALGRGSAHALSFFGRMLLWAFVVILALETLGYEPRTLVAGLGIGGIAVALAAQNVLGDLFAALAIYLDKPFVVGDAVVVDGGHTGTVEHIGLKTTRIRSVTGEQIVFANAELLKRVLRNHRRLYDRRALFTIDLPLDTDPEAAARVPALLREIVERHGTRVRFGRSHLSAITDTALRFETEYRVLDPDHGIFMDVQQAVYLDLLRGLRAQGLHFAPPRPIAPPPGMTAAE